MTVVSATVIFPELSMANAVSVFPAVMLKLIGSSPVVATVPTTESLAAVSEIVKVWLAVMAVLTSVTSTVTSCETAVVPSEAWIVRV